MDCERFINILAAAGDASSSERREARLHAAACERCAHLAAAFAAVEAALAKTEPAPVGFTARVVGRLPLAGRARAPFPSPKRLSGLTTWLGIAGAGVAAAALVGVVAYFAVAEPTAFAAAANAVAAAPVGDASTFATVIGGAAAAAAAGTCLVYYYFVPAN